MKKTFLHPQEIETFYVLPSLRKQFALALKTAGMKQKDIAVIMGITPASISQYHSAKRGDHLRFPAEVLGEIKKSGARVKDRLSYVQETQKVLQYLRSSGALCDIHRQFSEVPQRCTPEKVGCHIIPLKT